MPGRSTLVSAVVLGACLVLAAPALGLNIADATPPSGTVGVPYSYTFQLAPGSGSAGATWTIDSGQLPPGLRLSSNDRTATVYGTPTQAGVFHFYVKVRDKPGPWVCCTEEDFTIVIEPGLDITTGALPVGNVGSTYGYQLATSTGGPAAWSLSGGTLPAGIQLTADGAITGTPTQAVASQFTVKAVGGGKTATKQFTLKVTEPMSVSAPAAKAIKLGRQFLVGFSVKGGLGPYTWSGVGLPVGIGVNPTTGQVGGRPKQAGPLTVTVEVSDSLGAKLRATTVVTAATALAVSTAKLPVAHDGKRFRAAVRTSGGAAPVALKLAGAKPRWLRFDARTGKLLGTPKLKPRKPLVVLRKTKKGVRRIVTKRPPLAASYTLYVTATDVLGQRSTKKLKLTVRP